MSIFFILFFFLRLSTAQDDCTPKNCSDHGPKISFPFRLKNHDPPHCGCPGFDLSCSPNTTHLTTATTVLELPNSVKVVVTNIDYESRLIHIKDRNSCFPQLLQNLNLSTTPFEFADFVSNFSLFSCPSTKSGFSYNVTCLGGDGHEVYTGRGDWEIYYVPLISCRKMYTLSVPNEAFNPTADLQLKWPIRLCGERGAEGKFCGFPLSLLSPMCSVFNFGLSSANSNQRKQKQLT